MNHDAANSGFDFSRLRIEYMQRSLDESDAAATPIAQFSRWLTEAISGGAHEPNAMTLATATPGGLPSARIVLLKNVDEEGFTFFTNYLSRKGKELAENPYAALVFYWPELERQIRFEGKIVKTSSQESADYFNSRPVDARFGSASSPQSARIESRDVLEKRQQEFRSRYPDGNIPCPPHWGGYRLRPIRAEFWQGRPSRLHDRIEYLLEAGGQWKKHRLAP